ncbi:nitroreductase family protein [Thermodesulfobacteriota bacterium]
MQVNEAIANRLSIRKYAEVTLPPDHMALLFKALQLSPSSANSQNREFIFVNDPDIKKELVYACYNQGFVQKCNYFIAGVADPLKKYHQVDVTIALTNFTLQATELGYGTCWIGAFDEVYIKELLRVPENKKVVVCMTFGKPLKKPLPRNRKPLEQFVYMNSYGQKWELG